MNQPGQTPTEPNPYEPPVESGQVRASYTMPPLHWPRTIAMFIVFFLVGLVTYGTAMPIAFAILFGGIRTALIYRGCSLSARVPPSYIGSTIVSPILCLIFQLAAGVTFFFVCASLFAFDTRPVSEQAWLTMTGIVALAVFAVLYVLSIRIAVASSRPIQQAPTYDNG